jgi:K+-transporting ATPase ATPase C chain
MIRNALRALMFTVVMIVLTGLVYPLAMTGLAQVAMKDKADGSLVEVDDDVVGSSMIGQLWAGPEWFYGRPSATDYDGALSSGTNMGPLSQALADAIGERVAAIVEIEGPYHPGLDASGIPVDLLTASGSGLDPDITPEAAAFQAARIAEVRGLSLEEVQRLIDEHTTGRDLGFLGESHVNVLELNLALDELAA